MIAGGEDFGVRGFWGQILNRGAARGRGAAWGQTRDSGFSGQFNGKQSVTNDTRRSAGSGLVSDFRR